MGDAPVLRAGKERVPDSTHNGPWTGQDGPEHSRAPIGLGTAGGLGRGQERPWEKKPAARNDEGPIPIPGATPLEKNSRASTTTVPVGKGRDEEEWTPGGSKRRPKQGA